jgi:hypothetical protein
MTVYVDFWVHNFNSIFVISTGYASSPWDHVSPSPVPIRPSGSSVRSSSSRNGGRSHQLNFYSENSEAFEVLYLQLILGIKGPAS